MGLRAVDELDHASLAKGCGAISALTARTNGLTRTASPATSRKLFEMSPEVKSKIDVLWPKLGL